MCIRNIILEIITILALASCTVASFDGVPAVDVECLGLEIISISTGGTSAKPGDRVYFKIGFKNNSNDYEDIHIYDSTEKTSLTYKSKSSVPAGETVYIGEKNELFIDIDKDYDAKEDISINWYISGEWPKKGTLKIPVSTVKKGIGLIGYHIIASNNEANKVYPGSVVYFDMCFKNLGNINLYNTEVKIESLTDGVTIDSKQFSFGTIEYKKLATVKDQNVAECNYSSRPENCFSFNISEDFDVNTPIIIKWIFFDEKAYLAEGNISIRPGMQNSVFDVVDFCVIDTEEHLTEMKAGDIVYFDVQFKNFSENRIINPRLELSTEQQGVTILNGQKKWTTLESGKILNSHESNLDTAQRELLIRNSYSLVLDDSYDFSQPILIQWEMYGDNAEEEHGTFKIDSSDFQRDFVLRRVSFKDDKILAPGGGTYYLYFDFLNTSGEEVMIERYSISTSSDISIDDFSTKQRSYYYLDYNKNVLPPGDINWFCSLNMENYSSDTIIIEWKIEYLKKARSSYAYSVIEEGKIALDVNTPDPDFKFLDYQIIKTSNNDTKIQPGEQVFFDLDFKMLNNFSIVINDIELESDTEGVIFSKSTLIKNARINPLQEFDFVSNKNNYESAFCIMLDDSFSSDFVEIKWKIYAAWCKTKEGIIKIPVYRYDSDFSFVKYDILATSNGDCIVNPGEDVWYNIYIENDGIDAIATLKLEVLSEDDNVVVKNNIVNFATYVDVGDVVNIKGGFGTAGSNNAIFAVSDDYDTSKPIKFKWMVDIPGNEPIYGYFSIPVEKVSADIEFIGTKIVGTSNDDYDVSPSEQIYFDLSFKNNGTSTLLNPKLKIKSNTVGVELDASEIEWSDIKASRYMNASTSNLYYKEYANNTSKCLSFDVPNDYDVNKPIEIEWKLSGDGGFIEKNGVIEIPVKYVQANFDVAGIKKISSSYTSSGKSLVFDICFKNSGSKVLNPVLTLRPVTDDFLLGPVDNISRKWDSIGTNCYMNTEKSNLKSMTFTSNKTYTYFVSYDSNKDYSKGINLYWVISGDGIEEQNGIISVSNL